MHLTFEDAQVIRNVFGANPSTADRLIELLTQKSDSTPKDGEDGRDGSDGSVWYVQDTAPKDARDIDYWMQINGIISKKINGKWVVVANMKGRDGEDAKGDRGDTPTLVMGKVETLEARSQVRAALRSTRKPNEYALDLAIPVGEDGSAPTLKRGDVIKLKPGSKPQVSITGKYPDYEVNFGIPEGEKGEKGESVKGDKGDLAQYRKTQRIMAQEGSTHVIEESELSEILLLISGDACTVLTIAFPNPKSDQIIKIVSKVPVKNVRLTPEDRIASKPQSFTPNGFYEFFYDSDSKIFYRTG